MRNIFLGMRNIQFFFFFFIYEKIKQIILLFIYKTHKLIPFQYFLPTQLLKLCHFLLKNMILHQKLHRNH